VRNLTAAVDRDVYPVTRSGQFETQSSPTYAAKASQLFEAAQRCGIREGKSRIEPD
jgi:hypothetical protein